ncbi:MAG: indole-3-glycerol phosphate synthase TrpC [Candidatus Latescibacteria bacterium]|nr:indole-3-glycerol phosphate synthase TrpC [Candidatus Latescibacterota bacterium]
MANILEDISAYKREFVAARKRQRTFDEVRSAARDTPEPADFKGALQGDDIALIAEIKKASPSKGLIRADFDPERIAATYAESGARALSVLTDEAYFQGSDAYLQQARRVAGLPVLRKDFTIDLYQIHEARLIGADAVLLIVALMDGSQLEDFAGWSRELGLAALVEVHTAEELVRAQQAGVDLIGINNRNLKTFETRLETTFELLPQMPQGALSVSESAIHQRTDVEKLQAAGVDAMLVGEAFMREDDIGAKVAELLGR